MLDIKIPGYGELRFSDLVLDYNGTIAVDGVLIAGVEPRLNALATPLRIHVLTADTFGSAASSVADMPVRLTVLGPGDQARAKADYVEKLGGEKTVAIGNGRNDRLMLKKARLGIVVLESEGAAVGTLTAADVLVPTILDALDLLLHPKRLVATLRS